LTYFEANPPKVRTKECDGVNTQTFSPSKEAIDKAIKAIKRSYRVTPQGTWITIYLRNKTILAKFPEKITLLEGGSAILQCRETAWSRAWKITVPVNPEDRWTVRPA